MRLGLIAERKNGPHRPTYRETERTSGLIPGTLAKDEPDGLPSDAGRDLRRPARSRHRGGVEERERLLAVDWTDMESFSRPPPAKRGPCADPQASWGHRKNNLLRSQDELFFGYQLSAAIMMPTRTAPPSPYSPAASPCPPAATTRSAPWPGPDRDAGNGIGLSHLLAHSGYAHRDPSAGPSRCAPRRQLVKDLDPPTAANAVACQRQPIVSWVGSPGA